MNNNSNPLIGETSIDTVQNVAEAMTELVRLLSTNNSGLCLLLQPLLQALEHAAEQQE